MKKRLERAATRNGRSLSQEVELRLERSLYVARHLSMAQGDLWSPVLFSTSRGELWIGLGDDPGADDQEHLVVLKAEGNDLERLRNYFNGAPWPYTQSNAEIEAAGDSWIELQNEIKRGK